MFRVWWGICIWLCYKFPTELNSERILKIGHYLVKLWARVRCLVFFDSLCRSLYNGSNRLHPVLRMRCRPHDWNFVILFCFIGSLRVHFCKYKCGGSKFALFCCFGHCYHTMLALCLCHQQSYMPAFRSGWGTCFVHRGLHVGLLGLCRTAS